MDGSIYVCTKARQRRKNLAVKGTAGAGGKNSQLLITFRVRQRSSLENSLCEYRPAHSKVIDQYAKQNIDQGGGGNNKHTEDNDWF